MYGNWRPCGDYRALNYITVPDHYSLPHICTRFYYHLTRFHHFSRQSISPDSTFISKTAITTPFGLNEFVQMTFGLRNAAKTFQRFINEVLRALHFSYAYIDDVPITSFTTEEHKQHFKLVFDHFRHFGVTFNPTKCKLGVMSLHF